MLRIELLSRKHDRSTFDCGSGQLNFFLQQTARQHLERGISRTFVLVDESGGDPKRILGYFSLTMCQLQSGELPIELAKGLPREIRGIKLGRLAVAKERQGERLGAHLLTAAMQKSLEAFESIGGVGLFVDARDLRAQMFYEKFGFVQLSNHELKLFLPMETIRSLVSNH